MFLKNHFFNFRKKYSASNPQKSELNFLKISIKYKVISADKTGFINNLN